MKRESLKGKNIFAYIETRWCICGVHGLYIGQWHTKKEAISSHISDIDAG